MYKIAFRKIGESTWKYADEGQIELRHQDLNKGRIKTLGTFDIQLADEIEVAIYNANDDSYSSIFTGRVSLKRQRLAGKNVPSCEIEIVGNEESLNTSYVKLWGNTLTEQQWINTILGEYANEYPPEFYDSFNEEVPFKSTYQKRLDVLRDFCKKRGINFYFKEDGTPVFYKDTIEIVNNTVSIITEIERVEDLRAVLNSLKLEAFVWKISDGDLTESLPSSFAYYYKKEGWSEPTVELDSNYKEEGNYSVMASVDFFYEWFPEVIDGTLVLSGHLMRSPAHLWLRFSLPFDIAWEDFTHFTCWLSIFQENDKHYQVFFHPEIILVDPDGNISFQDIYYGTKERKTAKWSTKLLVASGFTVPYGRICITKEAFSGSISTIRYIEIHFGEPMQEFDSETTIHTKIWIDAMGLAVYGYYTLSVNESVNLYGAREAEPLKYTKLIYPEELLLAAASIALEEFSKPEITLRRVRTTEKDLVREVL